jgi:murein L,D-transpeptidase YcbB/YkuD
MQKGGRVGNMNKICAILAMVFILGGCVTPRNDAETNNFNMRLNMLESRLNAVEQLQIKTEQPTKGLKPSLDKIVAGNQSSSLNVCWAEKDIQSALTNAGYYKGPVDGKLGSKTKQAIKDFQKANGLKADGVAGKQTKAKLLPYLTAQQEEFSADTVTEN